jgi:hypothetical protein
MNGPAFPHVLTMIHSSSLETAETRRLRQEFLKHVRARPESVLSNARRTYAGSGPSAASSVSLKAKGPPPLAEASEFSGRPPSASNEVKFLIRNSMPAHQPVDTSIGASGLSGRPSSPFLNTSSCHPKLEGAPVVERSSGDAVSFSRSSPARLPTKNNQELEASGVSIPGPEIM